MPRLVLTRGGNSMATCSLLPRFAIRDRGDWGNFLFRSLGVPVALSVPGITAAAYSCNFPEPVTPIARETLHIHNEFMLINTFLFVTVFAIMLFIVFVLMGIPAVQAIINMEDTKTRADMVLKVTGMQWKWQYEYPEAGVKFISTLATPRDQISNAEAKGEHYLLEVDKPVVLPVGKKVRILLTSTDVIHTWWVPQFGVKRDAIPGFLRETWVLIEKPGVYRGQCAELCGKDHGFMPVVVHAVSEPEYLAWLEAQKAEAKAASGSADKTWSRDELMAKGKEVYEKTCAACHQPEGQGPPPAFPALAGSKIVNGPLLDMNGKIIKDSHVDRVMHGKAGTAMQAFSTSLSDVELAAIITYERNSFGNQKGDMIQPTQIKSLR